MRTFVLRVVVQLAKSTPANITTTIPNRANGFADFGTEPSNGKAGSELRLKLNGEIIVADPRAKPVPEK